MTHQLTAELLQPSAMPSDTNIIVGAADLPGARALGSRRRAARTASAPGRSRSRRSRRRAPSSPTHESPCSRHAKPTTGAELALAAARAAIDPDAAAAMITADDALEAARRARDEAAARVRAAQADPRCRTGRGGRGPTCRAHADNDRGRRLEQRRQEVLEALAAHADHRPHAGGRGAGRAAPDRGDAAPPVEEALALADAWAALQERRATLPPPAHAHRPHSCEAALEALEAARLDHAQAQEARPAGPPDARTTSPRSKQAHAAVVDAEEKVEGKRMASPMARRRLEAAEAAEQAGARASRSAELSRVPVAHRAGTVDARSRRSASNGRTQRWSTPRRCGKSCTPLRPTTTRPSELAAEAGRLRDEAVALLGGDPGGDVEGALRALRQRHGRPRARAPRIGGGARGRRRHARARW